MNGQNQEILVLSVSQLTNAIKISLETTFPSICLQGEISNCKLHSSGHLYFSLKDSNAQIAAVMYRANSALLKKIPKDGDSVVVKGSLNVYPPSGRYQMTVTELNFVGVGELLLKLEELKKKLHLMGWFDKSHKKAIPKLPRRIGVVTSPTGAAIQDILNILTRRFSGFHLILNPVRVQGEGAAQEIARAIEQFNEAELVDVMIVGRGGGSIEDLWAFNEEIVASAIFHSKIPIIAAVGHETDHCIAEYVADMRAPTPSAAAEMVMAEKERLLEALKLSRLRSKQMMSAKLSHLKLMFEAYKKQPLIVNPYALIGTWIQKLDDARHHLDLGVFRELRHLKTLLEGRKKILVSLSPKAQIQNSKDKLRGIARQLDQQIEQRQHNRKDRLKRVVLALSSIDPKNLLSRGYSILFSEKERKVITSVARVKKSETLRILLADGEIATTVNEIFQDDKSTA